MNTGFSILSNTSPLSSLPVSNLNWNGNVVRVTALVFTGDVEDKLQRLQWIPELSPWRPLPFCVHIADPCCGKYFGSTNRFCKFQRDNPCYGNGDNTCRLEHGRNKNFIPLTMNDWNITCNCARDGYNWKMKFQICAGKPPMERLVNDN